MGEFVIYETDERMFYLKRLLAGLRPLVNTHIFAPNLTLTAERLERVGEGEMLICGKLDEKAAELASQKGVKVRYLMSDEKFMAKNALLTAEATLALIIDHSMLSLARMKVLVIGFGRTGAALVHLLDRLAVDFDIATSSVRPAAAFATRVTSASSVDLAEYDVIVNTAPERLISDARALTMRPDAVYIDLASRPAVDIAMLRNLGLDADIYPALPAKCSPESAAEAMKDFVLEVTA